MTDEQKGIWNGVTVQSNGSISDEDARRVRKRLRILITSDVQRLAIIVAEIVKLQNSIANLECMEFAVEDLTDPGKEL